MSECRARRIGCRVGARFSLATLATQDVHFADDLGGILLAVDFPSLQQAWSIYGTAAGIMRVFVPLVLIPFTQKHFPALEPSVLDLAWEIPFWIFVILSAVRIFLAPYWINRGREREIKILEGTVKDLTEQVNSPPPQWLVEAIEKDRTSIEMMVRILKCTVSLQLNAVPAYLGLEFLIFNGSIHPILLNTLEGFILYNGRKLEGRIVFSKKWRPENIPHGYVAFTEIFQYLTDEEVEILRHDQTKNPRARSDCRFILNNFNTIITGGANAERVIPKPLSLYGFSEITLDRTIIG